MSSNFREFVNDLENEGELHRVTEEVDPVLEITEIAIKLIQKVSLRLQIKFFIS